MIACKESVSTYAECLYWDTRIHCLLCYLLVRHRHSARTVPRPVLRRVLLALVRDRPSRGRADSVNHLLLAGQTRRPAETRQGHPQVDRLLAGRRWDRQDLLSHLKIKHYFSISNKLR